MERFFFSLKACWICQASSLVLAGYFGFLFKVVSVVAYAHFIYMCVMTTLKLENAQVKKYAVKISEKPVMRERCI